MLTLKSLNLNQPTNNIFIIFYFSVRNFMHVKENLFGEDQRYTPMDEQVKTRRNYILDP